MNETCTILPLGGGLFCWVSTSELGRLGHSVALFESSLCPFVGANASCVSSFECK